MPLTTSTTLLSHHYANELADLSAEVKPFPVSQPKLVCHNLPLAEELGLRHLFSDDQALLKAIFAKDGELQQHSIAQKYGGHQFGQWNPQLGDGRGLLLGEVRNKDKQLVDLHLKGAGPTPYSRHADGRAVLRSTIREYLASEALHHLNIPSSRSLALIASKEPIMREQLEPGAMMIRTSPSHIRFGHFEYFYHAKEFDKLDKLFEFCFTHHFTHLAKNENPHLALLTEICKSTATLIAKWQAYGFNHGVMNTDNMSIHGITFDFGPYAFLDDFIPQYICNKSDHSGRYAFNQQPSIGLWNLNALAHAFSEKLSIEQLKEALAIYEPTFLSVYQQEMFRRFGMTNSSELPSIDIDKNTSVCNQFVRLLSDEFADLHISFRHLSEQIPNILEGDFDVFVDYFKQTDKMRDWAKVYQEQMQSFKMKPKETQDAMLAVNPKFILRNHHMQNVIAAAENDDFSALYDLLNVIQQPFTENETLSHLAKAPTDSEKGIALSCSS